MGKIKVCSECSYGRADQGVVMCHHPRGVANVAWSGYSDNPALRENEAFAEDVRYDEQLCGRAGRWYNDPHPTRKIRWRLYCAWIDKSGALVRSDRDTVIGFDTMEAAAAHATDGDLIIAQVMDL